MAEPKVCSQCEKTSTAVWRTDKETKALLCSPCYLKKFHRQPKMTTEENGVKKKKKKIELKSKADPIADLHIEEKKKKSASVKEEVKREEKVEDVKEEVKEEEDTGAGGEGGLADIFGAATAEVKQRKHEARPLRDNVLDQVNGPPPDVSVQSDTEYDEVAGTIGPHVIVVESSGNSKLDGRYDRLPKPSRGRPAYFMKKKEKEMFLYWLKGWKISSDFGSTKSFARIKDVPGLMDCVEPYPHCWQVYDKESTKYHRVVAMRVFDGAAESSQLQLPEPLFEAQSSTKESATASGDPADVAATEPRKKAKKEKKEAKESKKDEAAKEDEAPKEDKDKAVVKTEEAESAAAEDKAEKKEETIEKEEAASSQSDSSSEEKSESESQSPSSDDEGKKGGDGEESANKVCASCGYSNPAEVNFCGKCGKSLDPAEIKRLEKEAERKQKADVFRKKLHGELDKVTATGQPKAIEAKLDQIKKMMEDRKKALFEAAGFTVEGLKSLLDELERDYLPPEREEEPSSEPIHRSANPDRSVLKPRGAPKNKERRIVIAVDLQFNSSVAEVPVASLRNDQELWYQMPGSIVNCDHCGAGVPQSMGSLQGAAGQSQFAQCTFHCQECVR